MYESIRIIGDLKPKYVVWENVKNLLSEEHRHNFDNYLNTMQDLGYDNYYKVLNAKDFGIPQNRERIYTVSIRKDQNKGFQFPKARELKLRLKDMLEDNVDEKYYLSDSKLKRILSWKAQQKPLENVYGKQSIVPTLTARGAGEEHSGMVLLSQQLEEKENCELYIREKTKQGFAIATNGDGIYINRPHEKRGVVQKGMIQTLKCSLDVGVVVNEQRNQQENASDNLKTMYCNALIENNIVSDGDVISHNYTKERISGEKPIIENKQFKNCSPTLTTRADCLGVTIDNPLRIRKLTPKECFRLMGFWDKDIDCLIRNGVSNAQLYKQAGNSIVVDVLVAIFDNLFHKNFERKEQLKQMTIFDF